ncbi:hypothetical protein GCM10022378_11580 [Salinicoccus jeotgali]|uniref:N4-gp56 family major capsid protein n=1 Tax=Salinicoccus jeotgali TaxID=381634 RepID=A0ABP7ER24_9STAP
MAQTQAANLVNPQVMADAISAELPNKIKFSPFASVDNTLVGRGGDTITRPKYAYIGAAEDLTEGVPMDPTAMSMTTTQVTVKEAGKAVEVTETAILTNVDGTLSEAQAQLAKAMADKIDIDYVAALAGTAQSFDGAPNTVESVLGALKTFGDEDAEDYVLFMNPSDYYDLIQSLFTAGGSVQDRALTKGQVSEIVGVTSIVTSNRITAGEAYLQKQGAVEIVYKKQPEINVDPDILARTVVLAGNEFYAVNLKNDNGVVKIASAGV